MSNIVQRTNPRIAFEAPIRYAALNTISAKEFHSTRSLNFSAGGICYQSAQPLEPAAEVCIVMENYTPGRFGLEGYRSYLARICWTRPLSDLQKDLFAFGAQIIARSHEVFTIDVTEPRHICDLCGALMPVSRLRSTNGNEQLCELCYRHVEAIPPGKVRHCLSRFLMGNVV